MNKVCNLFINDNFIKNSIECQINTFNILRKLVEIY